MDEQICEVEDEADFDPFASKVQDDAEVEIYGVARKVLMRLGGLEFLVNFSVINEGLCEINTMLLGISFLYKAKVDIDVYNGTVTFRISNREVLYINGRLSIKKQPKVTKR
ncbi:hypothetical protein Sjap_022037 [Stephania japonica]|uniref:Uncharacterized protein n=1 Tax=Stephania japonica TaxID=461633 RepID=A0AAP0HUN4_9MAGN